MLQTFLARWPVILASQVIDIREFTWKEIFNLLVTVVNTQNVTYNMTASLTNNSAPNYYAEKFALHLFSKCSVNWIPSILRFGSTSLPNIVYCCESNEVMSVNSLCQMNSIFINWLDNPMEDEALIKLGGNFPLICFTVDYRLYFFSSTLEIEDLKEIIEEEARKNNISAVFTQKERTVYN
jgi:hypothetical protein